MNIYSIYGAIFKVWRFRRFQLFVERIRPSMETSVLDVGGYPGTWTTFPPYAKSITCLNIHPINWNTAQFPKHNISVTVGDARHMHEVEDHKYDIVFSNSVIEHVGEWQDQQAFAREVRRVGGKLWVQTPARECPFEPHYLAPFIHWLPKHWQKRLIRWCTVYGWIQRPSSENIAEMVTSIRLLKKSEMMALFPDCEILVESLWGVFPKSYIAVRKD